MVNSKLLRTKMILFGDTNETLAEVLGVSRQTMSGKITGRFEFWQHEIKIIIERYNLTLEEICEIFFN